MLFIDSVEKVFKKYRSFKIKMKDKKSSESRMLNAFVNKIHNHVFHKNDST